MYHNFDPTQVSPSQEKKRRVVRISLIEDEPDLVDPFDVKIEHLVTANRDLHEQNQQLKEKLEQVAFEHHALLQENEDLRLLLNESIVSCDDLLSGSLSIKGGSILDDAEEGYELKELVKAIREESMSTETQLVTEEEMIKSNREWDRIQTPKHFLARKWPGSIPLLSKHEIYEKEYAELQEAISFEILKRASLEQGKSIEAENPEVLFVTEANQNPFKMVRYGIN